MVGLPELSSISCNVIENRLNLAEIGDSNNDYLMNFFS